MVEADSHAAVRTSLVTKGILHLGFALVRCICKVIVSHGDCNRAVAVDLVVIKDNLGPALAAIDCEAAILRSSITHSLGSYEVGHGLVGIGPELNILGFGWLERHVAVSVAVQFTCSFGGGCNIVTCHFLTTISVESL